MIEWGAHVIRGSVNVTGLAQGPEGSLATADADICLLPPTEYGVPPDVPRERVYRFSRCRATPRGRGGGSVALTAALTELDAMGIWTVLEASPYPGQDQEALYAFYRKHGFRHCPGKRQLMFRPPGGP